MPKFPAIRTLVRFRCCEEERSKSSLAMATGRELTDGVACALLYFTAFLSTIVYGTAAEFGVSLFFHSRLIKRLIVKCSDRKVGNDTL